MHRTPRLLCLFLLVAGLSGLMPAKLLRREVAAAERPPNFIVIFADDLGYGDIGSFGARGYATPHLDRMAREGVRLTNFYVAQAVCSASRAALLTGCYSNRVGIRGALDHTAKYGLNPAETTIAAALKPRGYATGMFGKWHLGHHPQFLPVHYGFDEYYGLPYSNDMWPNHPVRPNYYPPLPLIEGDKVIAQNPDQTQLTTAYTERAVKFIERNKDKPFFLYVAHTMPHVPLHVSSKFKGKTERGLYGDVIEELDWSVGQILDAVKRAGLDEKTLVIFMSDNGPWTDYGNHAGSTGGLRADKGTAFEGGVRVPFVARWPQKIPAGTVSASPLMTIDVLPTLVKLAGAKLPTNRTIDGRDIWPLLAGERKAKNPHDALYFYWGEELHAVRSGAWKLHLPHPYKEVIEPANDGRAGRAHQVKTDLALYNLEQDAGETKNVAAEHPDVVKRLLAIAERAREDLGDSLTKRAGHGVRTAGGL